MWNSINSNDPRRNRSGRWLAIGVAVGCAVGIAIDNLPMSIFVGIFLGGLLTLATSQGET